jgi:hypothetical protein
MRVLPLLAAAGFALPVAADSRCYELRIYHAHEGKLEALHTRFRDHTLRLFAKHGMTSIGCWVPAENPDRKLYFILSYPDRAARETAWQAFVNDPEWKAAAAASEQHGKLVAKAEVTFLRTVDYSPAVAPSRQDPPRLFEWRTYTATPGQLDRLHARFRDHTVGLFSKHGMGHFGYWVPDADQPGAGATQVYLITHASEAARQASFDGFRADPAWVAARTASEEAAGGPLTVKDGVQSLLLLPTDYSPTR